MVVRFNNGDGVLFPGTTENEMYALLLSGSPGGFVHRWLKTRPYMKVAWGDNENG